MKQVLTLTRRSNCLHGRASRTTVGSLAPRMWLSVPGRHAAGHYARNVSDGGPNHHPARRFAMLARVTRGAAVGPPVAARPKERATWPHGPDVAVRDAQWLHDTPRPQRSPRWAFSLLPDPRQNRLGFLTASSGCRPVCGRFRERVRGSPRLPPRPRQTLTWRPAVAFLGHGWGFIRYRPPNATLGPRGA